MASLGTSAIFAGIGAAQGLGQGMNYENHLRDAVDVAHQQVWDKEHAQDALDKANEDYKTQGRIQEENATKYQQISNDDTIRKTRLASGIQDGIAPQQQPQAPSGPTPTQPIPGMAPQGQTPQAPQGQGQPQQVDNSAIQPRTQPLTPPAQPRPVTPMPDQLGQGNPQGRLTPASFTQNTVPPPPPLGQISPDSPAALTSGKADNVHTLQSKDPYDIVSNGQGWVQNTQTGQWNWVQERHDLADYTHKMYNNLTPDQVNAAVEDYMPKNASHGNWMSKQSWNEHMQKLDAQAAKYEGGPVPVDSLPDQSKEYMQANKNLGLSNTTNLQPLRPSEEIQNAKVFQSAQQAKQAAGVGINTMNSLFSSMGVNSLYGPMAATQAKLSTALSSMTDGEVAKNVDNWWVQNKDSIVASNQMLRTLPGGSRAGIGLLNREIEGVPSATMSPEAEKQMVLQYYSSFRQAANYSDALMNGPGKYVSMEDRIQHANAYAKQNPAVLADGVTPNPDFKDYDQWVSDTAKGVKSTGATESSVRNEGLSNITKPQEQKQQAVPQEVMQALPAGATNIRRIK